MSLSFRIICGGAVLVMLGVASAFSQSPTIDGPPAPVAPEVITRGPNGQATVRAIRLSAPLKVDGLLDEAGYQELTK